MSDITCFTYLLDIPRFSVYLVTTISSTNFTWLSNNNIWYIRGKAFSYVIVFPPILFKKLATLVQGTGFSLNSKPPSSHTPYTVGLRSISSYLFSLGHLYSLHHKVLFRFADDSSLLLVTLDVSCSDELSYLDSIGMNSPKPTTNLSCTVTLICFLHSSRLAFSYFVLTNFHCPHLLLLKYSWIWHSLRYRGREGRQVLEE